MELRKYFYKSYHAKPKIKLKKILDDNLFFKRSLILKMALNKNIKINTNYRIDRLMNEKNLSYSKKHDNSDDSFENKMYEKIYRKKNLLYELENILENNNKKTEKFVESFKDLKEENIKFLTGYEDIKIPVEDRIKKFIFNTLKIFQENDMSIQLKSKKNNKPNLIDKEGDDLEDLWAQNRAAVKLFKQCPLTLNDEKEIYFYYISNYLGEKLNINDHKYIKFLNQIKDYLDFIKNEKSPSPSPPKKESKIKNKKTKEKFFKDKEIVNKNNIEKKEKKESIIKNMKKIPLNEIQDKNLKLDAKDKTSNQENNNNNKLNDNLNNNSNDSKNKNTSRNNVNSTQEFPSKDTFNLVSISNYENKNNNNNNNIYNIHKINDLSCNNTPNNKKSAKILSDLKTEKKIYLNTCTNKNIKNFEEIKVTEQINKYNTIKKLNYNFNKKNLFQNKNNILHRIPSENLSHIQINSLSKINMKKQISSKMIGNYRKFNKRTTMNLDKYINDIKIKDKNNNFINLLKNNEKIINPKSSQHLDELRMSDYIDISPINNRNSSYNLVSLYEKTKKNNSLNKKSLEEINQFLKSKGIKNDEILKEMQFNSDNAFINLKSKTNKLNIEAKTKAFFYGIIPNERKKKLEQLNNINTKINQIERDYIKTLIDKDLKFNN